MDKFLKIHNFQKSLQAFKLWMGEKHLEEGFDLEKQLFETMKQVKNEYVSGKLNLPPDVSVDVLNNLALNTLQDMLRARRGGDEKDEGAIPLSEFNKRLEARLEPRFELNTQKSTLNNNAPPDVLSVATVAYVAPVAPDPTPKPVVSRPTEIREYTSQYNLSGAATETQLAAQVAPKVSENMTRYAMVNGFDRNWRDQPNRHEFMVDFSSVGTYKLVTKIWFTSLILPCENISSVKPQLISTMDMKMSFPYILMQVTELDNRYVGLNNAVKNATVCFLYDTSYKCTNGRSYIILRPAQDEVLHTRTSLSRMSFSFRRPTGSLISDVRDDYGVHKIEYELYNSLYLKVIFDKYFDKSEFNVGDNIKVSGYSIYKPDSDDITSASDYIKINQFINRPEGHDIVQLGDANENGFYKYGYITGPSTFDSVNGKVVVDKRMVDALKNYNLLVSPSPVNGFTINTSIQPVIHMTFNEALNS